jgi:DNA-directed RNA polymerase II subunit RPB2
MEGPKHILSTFFKDVSFPLVQHHIDSYNDFLDVSLPNFFKNIGDISLETSDGRFIKVYLGGKDGSKIKFLSPKDEDDNSIIVPHKCRLEQLTYAIKIVGDIDFEYVYADGTNEVKTFSNMLIGEIPLMLRSKLCYLSGIKGEEVGECTYELGGYFVITGGERVLLTQEWLGHNMFYYGKRKKQTAEMAVEALEQTKHDNPEDIYIGIRTLSEDGTKGPYSHYMVLPPPSKYPEIKDADEMAKQDNRLVTILVTGFEKPVPVLSLFRALGVMSDRDLYEILFPDVSDKTRLDYDDIFYQIVLSHERFLKENETTDMEILVKSTKRKHISEVIENIYDRLFSNIEIGSNLFRQKSYVLGHMLRTIIDVFLEKIPISDRDNIQFKRFQTSGVLMYEEFIRIFNELSSNMRLALDTKLQYNSKLYEGKNLSQIVDVITVGKFWRGKNVLAGFEKSFKGAWGGKVGISQILSRLSYLDTIHHLRKTNLQISADMNTAPPRRLYASQFGLLCPIDSPDGSSIGHTKGLAIFSKITTAVPAKNILKILESQDNVVFIENIHPSTWNPEWTQIMINGILVGVCMKGTETFHKNLIKLRRKQEIPIGVSLSWKRLENLYKIECGAGRIIRPVYREGTTETQILKCKTWGDIIEHLDYLDAAETDVTRLSIEPYDPELQSEIHMTFNMSALVNLNPFLDHNPATRNTFAVAHQKQACSWFHTNYQKRFDVMATLLVEPQKPVCHNWLYREILGGGSLPHGNNAIVAVTVYGGLNQEDSVILNEGSLKRGMFKTIYFHSYEFEEEVVQEELGLHTSIENLAKNPKYSDSVPRKDGKNYDLLDNHGIIKIGSYIDENTILVGKISPMVSERGEILGYRDVSDSAKRGHHGRVDSVYVYQKRNVVKKKVGNAITEEVFFIKSVKIRLSEERSPSIGDKMASRHSQKGTCGSIVSEVDMPFMASGIRPDIIYNPHGIPTRMTTGQSIESMSAKLALDVGTFVDSTPFSTKNRVADLKNALIARGFEPSGSEVLYNGMTGEQMEVDIFVGNVYYQRLKHMVADKINYRSTGEVTMMTRQPLKGRSENGGLAIGEMEKDALISHGFGKFLNESFMDRSDKAEVQFNRETGQLDTSVNKVEMPYAMSLFINELKAMHIDVHLKS